MDQAQNLVGFVQRALALKTLPVLSDASPDQIAAIVNHLRDRSLMPGQTLFSAGEAAREIHFLFEGRARLENAHSRNFRAGQILGIGAVLEQRPHAETCVAETPLHALTLRADDLFDLLEDFFDLTRSLLGYLATRVVALRDGDAHHDVFGDEGPPIVARRPLELIDKIVFMKGVPLLSGASIQELARLGREVAEIELQPGEVVARAGARAEAFHLVLSGRLGPRGPRTSIGALEVLADRPHARTLLASEPSRALRVPAEGFFDLLEDHFDLTLRIGRHLSRAVTTLQAT